MRTRLTLLVFAPLTTQRALLYLLGAALGLAAAPAARAQLASPFQECLQDPEKPGNVVKLSFHPGMERVGYELWCGKFTASGTAQFTIPGKFIEDSRGIPLYYSFTSFLEFDETSGDLVGGTVRLESRFTEEGFLEEVCSFIGPRASDCTGCREQVSVGPTSIATDDDVLELAVAGPEAAVAIVVGGSGDRLQHLGVPVDAGAGAEVTTKELGSSSFLFSASGAQLADGIAAGAVNEEGHPSIFLSSGDDTLYLNPFLLGVPHVVNGVDLSRVGSSLLVSFGDHHAGTITRQLVIFDQGGVDTVTPLPHLASPGGILSGFDNALQPQTAANAAGQVGTILQTADGVVRFNLWPGDTAIPLADLGRRNPNAEPFAPVEPALAFSEHTGRWGASLIDPVSEDLLFFTIDGQPPHSVKRFTLAQAPLAPGEFDFNQPALLATPNGHFVIGATTEEGGPQRLWTVAPDGTQVEVLGGSPGERGVLGLLLNPPPPANQPWDGVTSSAILSPGSLRVTGLLVSGAPLPPAGPWLTSPVLPGYRFKARIAAGSGSIPAKLEKCIAETVCLSGALAGRSELFLRLVGPKPNGHLWPNLVKFSTSRIEVWIEHPTSGTTRYYDLPAVDGSGDRLELAGLAHKTGFLPPFVLGATATTTEPPTAEPFASMQDPRDAEASWWEAATEDPAPPAGPWLETNALPGFRFKVRIGGARAGAREPACIEETLCVSGAVSGRAEVFARVVGPKPNGYLWPTLVKFSTSRIEVWIEQKKGGQVRYYDLPAVADAGDLLTLAGLADRLGFRP